MIDGRKVRPEKDLFFPNKNNDQKKIFIRDFSVVEQALELSRILTHVERIS